jgi:hypothetical protein
MQFNLVTQDALLWLTEDGSVIVEDSRTQDEGNGAVVEDQPFLQVNDRTSYKTPEDAKKGYEEAQKTITSLSGYRKVLEELGAPKDADPDYLRGVLSEYIKLVQEKNAAAKTPTKSTASDEDKEFEGVDPQIVAQTKRGRQWLKDNAEKVGLVSQEKYKALEDRLGKLEGGLTQKDASEREAAIEEGQQKISTWLSEAKVDLSSDEREELEDLIVAYVNSKPSLTKQWLGGDRSQKVELIRKGYEKFLGVVKPGASPVVKAAQTANAGKIKAGLLTRTPRRLPNEGGAPNDKGEKKPLKIGDPSLRSAAMKLMEKMDAERSGAGE